MRIPSPLVYATAALGAPLLFSPRQARTAGRRCCSALIGGAAAFAAFFALYFAVPKGIGFGDVRLAGLCGGSWAGSATARRIAGFLLSFILAGVPAVVLLAMHKVQRRTQIPFGPFLAAGTMISVLFGAADRPRLGEL